MQQKFCFYVAALDSNSLFTHISLDETMNNCMELVFKEDKIVSILHKKQVFQMLSMTSEESTILFDNKY